VPADLEERRLGDHLLACGFDRHASTFCSALGVTQYLDKEAVDALFGFAATLPKGSEIVFSFAPLDDQSVAASGDAFKHFGRGPAALGEPWKSRWRAADMVAQLAELGFGDVFHLTPELARQRYFSDQPEIPELAGWDHIIAAIV
jgi:O-methyltransferase involved in polyketide biosynthesis